MKAIDVDEVVRACHRRIAHWVVRAERDGDVEAPTSWPRCGRVLPINRSHRRCEAIEVHRFDTVYEEAPGGAAYLAAGTTTGNET